MTINFVGHIAKFDLGDVSIIREDNTSIEVVVLLCIGSGERWALRCILQSAWSRWHKCDG